jgi:hypothetical protein
VHLHRHKADRDERSIKQLVKLAFILLLVPVPSLIAQTSDRPDLSGVTQEDRNSIESACSYEKNVLGPAAYHDCLAKQLAALGGSRKPDLSRVAQQDRYSIESACSYEKNVLGPAAYHDCVAEQLVALGASRKPDLSGVTQEDRNSIESACSYEKNVLGPAAYHQCIDKQLNELRGTNRSFNNSTPSLSVSSQSASHPVESNGQTSSKPSPELQKLDYFRGGWVLEGNIKTSTFGPAGKFSGTQQNEWASDHLSMISRWSESRPGGNSAGKAVYNYDSNQKVYNYRGTDSEGEAEDMTGTVIANTWTWLSNFTGPSGDSLRGRYTETITSPISYDFKFDVAPQNGEWTTEFEGKAKKSK